MLASLCLFVGALVGAVVLTGALGIDFARTSRATAIALCAIVAVLGISAVREQRYRPKRQRRPEFSGERLLNKSIALGAGCTMILVVASLQAVLGATVASTFLSDLVFVWVLLPILIPSYVLTTERLAGGEEDALSSAGAALRGKRSWNTSEHKQLLLAWLVKAFFLPLMYGNLVLVLEQWLALTWPAHPTTWFVWFATGALAVDLLVATSGYLATGPLFRREIRSVDDSWSGWIVCLICYAPFYQYVKLVTEQRDELIWSDWLQPDQMLYWIWAAMLVLSWTVYWLSSIAFSLRFSNLTYRGLVDYGPYRYTKHPAYISKNIYWWLHTVPFVGVVSTSDVIANIAGLSAVGLIYYFRAKTEERHLMRFPEYVEYARRIEQRSLRFKLRQWLSRRARAAT